MKSVLKIIGIVILILIVAILVTGLFVSADIHVERQVSINKDRTTVFNFIKHLENQDKFSVWQQMDPNMKHTLTGTDGTVGAVSAWESDNEQVGVGEQEITNIKEGERIDFELRFKKPEEMNSMAYFTTADEGTGTKVAWGFDAHVPYPFNAFMIFAGDLDAQLGPDLEKGLGNLKTIMESEG